MLMLRKYGSFDKDKPEFKTKIGRWLHPVTSLLKDIDDAPEVFGKANAACRWAETEEVSQTEQLHR